MARSVITETSDDLLTDSGSVLWSLIKGEQLEFPITLNFITNATAGYTFEAAVVEALNTATQIEIPTAIRPSGAQTSLVVRVPTYRGNWDAAQAYNREEVVKYGNKYYKLSTGVARTNSATPDSDSTWVETALNKVYLQFPSTLGSNWQVGPSVNFGAYGFFELRVTEPIDAVYRRTWKPIRGLVELLFSPTDIVPDV
jgi:hypothetical protein